MVNKTFFLLLGFFCSLSALAKADFYKHELFIQALKRGQNAQATKLASLINPDYLSKQGITPLMMSAYKGNLMFAKLLATKALIINEQSQNNEEFDEEKTKLWCIKLLSERTSGTTALMLAAYAGHPGIVKLLLDLHADPNITDSENNTALIYALLGDKNWPKELSNARKVIIKLLLKAKANPFLENKDFLNALYFYKEVALKSPQIDGDEQLLAQDEIYQMMQNPHII